MAETSIRRALKNAPTGGDLEKNLLRIAHMFAPRRDDPLMRDLCRLAVKCVREGADRE